MTIRLYGYSTKLRPMKTKEHEKNGQNYIKIIKPHVPELFGNNLYTILIFIFIYILYIAAAHKRRRSQQKIGIWERPTLLCL